MRPRMLTNPESEPESEFVADEARNRAAPAGTIADRMKSRRAQEAKSTRRLQVIGGIVVAVIAVAALGFMLLK